MVTGRSNAWSPKRPCSVPETGGVEWLRSVTSTVTSAREVSGSGRVVLDERIFDGHRPAGGEETLLQMPMSRPRMVGIQSQPMVA